MKRVVLAAFLCAMAAFAIFDFVATLATCQQPNTEEHKQSAEKSCGFADSLTYRAGENITEWIDRRHDVVTAAATVVIAFFTIALWRATDRVWDAGERQLDHLAETAERQLRAYVFPIEAKLTKFNVGDVPECLVVAYNSGQTPAYRLTHVTRFALANFPLTEPLPECRASQATSKTNIAAQGKIDKFGAAHWPLSEAAAIRLGKGQAVIYVYGRIDFIDAFGHPRWVKYRYMTGGEVGFHKEGRLAVCNEGNETSEDDATQ